MINTIKLKLPELPTTKLYDLRKGKVFMTVRDFYSEGVDVYMVIKNDYSNVVTAVRLQDGETKVFGTATKVVELTVTLECKLHEPKDDLPF